jgi:hypothetical protein
MQHGEEDGAFECKPMLALTGELLHQRISGVELCGNVGK